MRRAQGSGGEAVGVIRVLIVDDHTLVRHCLRGLIDKTPGLTVVADAADGREAVTLAAKLRPHVVLMDIEMPGLNGVEATRQIVNQTPGVRVVALSGHVDEGRTARMFEAGASGYVTKTAAFEELLDAVRAAAAGRVYVSPHISDHIVSSFTSTGTRPASAPSSAGLTPREREVLQLVAEGKSTQESASVLHISIKTVETHRRALMEKLDVYSIAELTKYAIREGLTPLGD